MSEQRVDLIRSIYEAFGKGDMDTVAGALAETDWHEMEGMPYGGVYNGSEAIISNVFGPIAADVEGFVVDPDELLAAGEDRVVALGSYAGQGANGALDVAFAHLWTVRDGKITRFDQYADTKLFGAAVGK